MAFDWNSVWSGIATFWDKLGGTGQNIAIGLIAFILFLAFVYDKK